MSTLFTRTRIGALDIANRFVRSATGEGMCEADGRATESLARLYRALGQGGCGLVISGHTFVRADGKASDGMMGAHTDNMIPGLRRIADAVHESDARVVCQLNHAGRQTSPDRIGGVPPVAPSAVRCRANRVTPRALDADEIDPLIDAYADAARRGREAGFDGVQLHCAHGYLMSEFISPHTNRRTDAWGGSAANRARFPLETLRRVRAAVGPDYPVLIKLNSEDFLSDGLTLDESCRLAAMLEAEGIDAIEVSGGMAVTASRIVRKKIDSEDKEAYFADNCRAVRACVSVPLICVGGLRSLAVMERIVEDGTADLVALCRPLIRQPDLPNLFRNHAATQADCISCNQCTRDPQGIFHCPLTR